MNIRQALLSKLENTATNPRCPECNSRMKDAFDGQKCPKCGKHVSYSEAQPEQEQVKKSVMLVPVPLRPGVTDSRRVVVDQEDIGTIEQISRKWRVVSKSGISISNGLLSSTDALNTLIAWDSVQKKGTSAGAKAGWETRRRGGKSPDAKKRDQKKIEDELLPKESKRGKTTVSVTGASGKPLNVLIPNQTMKAIKNGATYDEPDMEDASARYYTDVESLRAKYPEGGAVDQINTIIGAQFGRARAYCTQASAKGTPPEVASALRYKAQRIVAYAEEALVPAMSRAKTQYKEKRARTPISEAPGI